MFAATPLPHSDWLLHGGFQAKIERHGHELVLSNGLVERRIRIEPFLATTSFLRLDTGQQFVRSTEPEAKLTIDGKEVWLGGTTMAPDRGYLTPAWLENMRPNPLSLTFLGLELVPVSAPVAYTPRNGQKWPVPGKAILLHFGSQTLAADVRLEIYDDIPVVAKQVTITNKGANSIRIDKLSSERLATVEGDSLVETHNAWHLPNLTCLTNMAFGGTALENGNAVHWEEDPEFGTQVNYALKTPCILDVHPPIGPSQDLAPGQSLDSLRSYVLLHDTEERERRYRETRALVRNIAPWVEDNPLMLHIQSSNDQVIKTALDQAAECGFEVAIISFGSGLDMEDTSEGNIAKWKALREYADSKGIRLGGYSLLASRRIDDENDVINVQTGKTGGAIFGNSPCLCSKWGIGYFEHMKTFLAKTGFRVLEHDGSYPGDPCASTTHPGHHGYEDSQWKQYQVISEFYRWCRARDIFMNVPDTYFLAGSNKTGMGYRETNWSLPREQQHVHARQNLFDGTFEKTPSMGWMFVPLTEYQGGGKAATIEPLRENLKDYELHFANNLGFGAQACWRGTRLYDAPETKSVVVRMVSWFKKYRAILESDVVHLRRADGRRLDYVLHANPHTSPRAMLMVYNPTDRDLTETIQVPLYYTGIAGPAKVQERENRSVVLSQKNGSASIAATVASHGWTYFVIH
jgi:hypothetical protein